VEKILIKHKKIAKYSTYSKNSVMVERYESYEACRKRADNQNTSHNKDPKMD
jgi:hypothetical protein